MKIASKIRGRRKLCRRKLGLDASPAWTYHSCRVPASHMKQLPWVRVARHVVYGTILYLDNVSQVEILRKPSCTWRESSSDENTLDGRHKHVLDLKISMASNNDIFESHIAAHEHFLHFIRALVIFERKVTFFENEDVRSENYTLIWSSMLTSVGSEGQHQAPGIFEGIHGNARSTSFAVREPVNRLEAFFLDNRAGYTGFLLYCWSWQTTHLAWQRSSSIFEEHIRSRLDNSDGLLIARDLKHRHGAVKHIWLSNYLVSQRGKCTARSFDWETSASLTNSVTVSKSRTIAWFLGAYICNKEMKSGRPD